MGESTYRGEYRLLRKYYDTTPDKEAAVIEKDRVTYRQIIDSADRVAAGLYDLGVRKGDRVGILLPNSVHFLYSLCGISRLGAISVPFDPQLGEWEMKVFLDYIGVRVLILAPQFRGLDHLAHVRKLLPLLVDLRKVVVDGDCTAAEYQLSYNSLLSSDTSMLAKVQAISDLQDTDIVLYTTGSTGTPKAVEVPYTYTETAYPRLSEYFGFHREDIFLVGMPLYHRGGYSMGLLCLAAGGKVIYRERFSPVDYLKMIETEKVSIIQLSPTLAKILLSVPNFEQYDLSSLRFCIFFGETFNQDLALEFQRKVPVKIINILAITEAGPFLVWDSDRDSGAPPNHLSPIPGYEVKIVNNEGQVCQTGETGTILVRGPLMKGYYRSQELTRKAIDEEGWLTTWDMGCKYADGRIEFRGRKKRIVRRGPNLVYPEEIETFLRTNPDIAAVGVDKEPSEIYGERIIAYVQPKQGVKTGRRELLEYCKGQISAYKIPDEFKIVPEVPMKMGKVDFSKLSALKDV